MSNDDLSQVVDSVKMDFRKVAASEYIVKDGERCDELLAVANGEIACEWATVGSGFVLIEFFNAPKLIQPEQLFGLSTHHTVSVRALTDVNVIAIGKSEILRLCADFLVVRLNLLNILSSACQRRSRILRHPSAKGLRNGFVNFVMRNSSTPVGRKELRTRIGRIAEVLDAPTRRVSAMLHELHDEGLLEMGRQRIVVKALEKLL